MGNEAIRVKNLEKVYRIYHKPAERLLDFFLPKQFGDRFYALEDVSFTVRKGESLGLIGLNGSGKTTLANILAGASIQTAGELETEGKVTLLSFNAGVDAKLTGLENIQQKGLLMGLSHKEIRELTPQIIEFSELGDFIHQQVRTYSSGMKSKLGFSISVNIDPDILIIDEALSVGDPTFTGKCLERMRAFRTSGKTIIFVSHSLPQVWDFCDTALWLEGGRVRGHGDSGEIIREYREFVKEYGTWEPEKKKQFHQDLQERRMRRAKK